MSVLKLNCDYRISIGFYILDAAIQFQITYFFLNKNVNIDNEIIKITKRLKR